MDLPEGATQVEEKKDNKLSYDELYKIAQSLNTSNAELQRRLNDLALSNFFTRLEFLFKVVKFSDKFPQDFVKMCIDEVVASMTIRDDDNKENQ